MGASISPEPLSDHDLYDQFRDRGLSHADAVKHVELRRTAGANAMTLNPADSAAAAPSPWLAAPVAFGHGASLGLAGDREYLAAARQANPKTMFAADVLGTATLGGAAAPLVAGLSPLAGGAVLGAGLGAGRGAIEPIPGFSRTESALIMGTGGAITGAVAGKLVSKLVPIAVTVAKNTYKVFGAVAKNAYFYNTYGGPLAGAAAKAAAPAAEGAISPAVQDVAEAAVRAELKRLNVHPAVVERTVQAWKTGKVPQGAIDLPPMEPTVSRVGETITPMEPQLPTMRAQADVMATQPAYMRVGNPMNLPTGSGPMASPAPGMPLGVPGTLQALEQQLGRPLTPPETQSALERLLGPIGGLPRNYGRPP